MKVTIVKAFIYALISEMVPDQTRANRVIDELNLPVVEGENMMESFVSIDYLEDAYRILQRETGLEHIGWEFGIRCNLDALGAFGYILKHAQSFEEVFKKYLHYIDVIGIGKKYISWHDDGEIFKIQVIVDWRWSKYAPFSAGQECEGFIAFLCTALQKLTRKNCMPVSIDFPGYQPADLPESMSVYLPVINFNAHNYSVRFLSKDIKSPIISNNPLLLKELERYVAKINNKVKNNKTYTYEVEKVLIEHYTMDFLSLPEIAKKLNCSPRCLQRKLKTEGTTFNHILRNVKYDIAQIYLEKEHLTMTETAYLLGFNDLPAFKRFMDNNPQCKDE